MKFDDLLCCPGCGGMFRPIRDEDICPKCTKDENQRLSELARELNGEQE